MARKLQTIYEYFSDYSCQEIDEVIWGLSLEEQAIIKDRYGDDLHHIEFEHLQKLDSKKKAQFYKILIPKMRRILEKNHASFQKISQLLQCIDQEKSHNKICENLKIDHRQLYSLLLELKNKGFVFKRQYYSDGTIRYRKITTSKELRLEQNSQQNKTIITNQNENTLKFLVLSDLHFGNSLERLDLVDRAFNYCLKNGIHIILCGGDLIDGTFTQGNQKITNPYQQIEYFLRKYPFDRNILTFSVLGNHDMSALSFASLSLLEACHNFRHDVVIGGFTNTLICIKNDQIHLYHQTLNKEMRKTQAPILLSGHSHRYASSLEDGVLNIKIPSLSQIIHPFPTALELTLKFSKGYISSSVLKQICFQDQDIILNESTYQIPLRKENNNEPIKNVEVFKPESNAQTKQLVKK